MKSPFLLWLNAVVFCLYLAAHWFDILIIVPNWKSGTVEDLRLYHAFFHTTDPRQFFTFLRPVSITISLLCLFFYWYKGSPVRMLMVISFLIDVLLYVVTLFYFSPINDFLFLDDGAPSDPAAVQEYVKKWIASNYIRIALITVGVYASLAAVHFSYRRS